MMNQQEFKDIKSIGEQKQLSLKKNNDQDKQNGVIELDLQSINIESVRYLQNFLNNPIIQNKWHQLMLESQLKQNAIMNADPLDEKFNLYDPQVYSQIQEEHRIY